MEPRELTLDIPRPCRRQVTEDVQLDLMECPQIGSRCVPLSVVTLGRSRRLVLRRPLGPSALLHLAHSLLVPNPASHPGDRHLPLLSRRPVPHLLRSLQPRYRRRDPKPLKKWVFQVPKTTAIVYVFLEPLHPFIPKTNYFLAGDVIPQTPF